MAETKLSLNLWILKDTNKLLFAEAGKDFIDFMFNLFSLPLGHVVNLLKDSTLGLLGNQCYESIVTLDDSYMISSGKKNLVLKPPVIALVKGVPQLFTETTELTVYSCGYGSHGFRFRDTLCEVCRFPRKNEGLSDGGFVKEMVKYMVMDDLSVKPMTMMEILNVLAQYKVEPNGACQQKVVQFGRHEAVKLLRTSLNSETTALSGIYNVKTEPNESIETNNSG